MAASLSPSEDVSFVRVSVAAIDDLATFLAGHDWPFHAGGPQTENGWRDRISLGWATGPGTETYWVVADGTLCGVVRIFDLADETALFDLRLIPSARGHGLGTQTVGWLAGHVFDGHPHMRRVEATTRADNHAMRRVLTKAGWVQESHWRQSWPDSTGRYHDAVGYGILRSDHDAGHVVALDWDDEPR